MTKDEALRMALEALEDYRSGCQTKYDANKAITAIKEALQSNEQVEPVGQLCEEAYGRGQVMWFNKPADGSYVYTHPPVPTAQPEQEPVARSKAYDMIDRFLQNNLNSDEDYAEYSKALDSIYTAPQAQRAWVGLTDEEMDDLNATSDVGTYNHIKAIEAKIKEKNSIKE